ncbi:BLUF domain-containing protein [Marinobacterium aestuariivivens]|uniref:BLUF domain-containing protein n=1 Tax=Marinobacterium aestuariivivens TaxID=1698799 RepID=A0ABW1ZVR9_9GAMM
MELIRCVYSSAANNPAMGETELESLLNISRRNNAELGITGMLLFHKGSFFQILEGERAKVEALYSKIELDDRHRRLTKIVVEPIVQRDFSHWSMGYPKVTAAELARIPGLNDFFSEGSSFLQLEEGRVKKLLAAFRDGRWHS